MHQPVVLALVATLLGAPVLVGEIGQQIDDPTLAQAVSVARQSDSTISAFHARYTVVLGDPTYDRVELITEYRRTVITAEEHFKLRELWDVNKARAALAPFRGLVSFVLWVKFPPQNTLLQPPLQPLPNYEMVVYPKGIPPPPAKPDMLRLTSSSQTILFGAGGGNFPVARPGTAMSGVRIEATTAVSSLDSGGRCVVGVWLDGKEQRQVVFNLGSLR